jgi:hypothetical protein
VENPKPISIGLGWLPSESPLIGSPTGIRISARIAGHYNGGRVRTDINNVPFFFALY